MTGSEPGIAARLHVVGLLIAGGLVALDPDQAHYLRHVLRLGPGDRVALFNGGDGEWSGSIEAPGRRGAAVRLERQTRAPAAEPDLWLLFAPVKRARIDYIAEKATELGVSVLWPVITEHTMVARVNCERLAANAREAAEQTGRLRVPEVREPERLDRVLAGFPPGRRLVLCDESGAAPPIAAALAGLDRPEGGWAVLIGPEGGFAPAELDALRKLPFVTPVGLGPRVLRADTAALAALAVLQALQGDWSARPDEAVR